MEHLLTVLGDTAQEEAPPRPPTPMPDAPKSILKRPKSRSFSRSRPAPETAEVTKAAEASKVTKTAAEEPAPIAQDAIQEPARAADAKEAEPRAKEPPVEAKEKSTETAVEPPKETSSSTAGATAEQHFVGWRPKKSIDKELIFVAIAAYRDTELLPTLESLLQNARFPDRLRFGICLQDTLAALNAFPYYGDARFRIVRVPAEKSQGCCWARHQMQRLYDGERYYLQLDSHHRFVKDWDARCLWMLHHCRSSKPILSTYLPPYTPATERQDVQLEDLYAIAITGYDKHGLVAFHPQRLAPDEYPLDEPRLAFMIAGGFIFTFGEWMTEVPYDPSLYFNGEEVSLTVRSWTRGWDIYCPNLVVAFHYYQRSEEKKHWDDHSDWRESNKSSVQKVLQQLKDGAELGELRSLQQYEAMAGLNFGQRSANANAKRGQVSKSQTTGYAVPEAGDCFASVVALSIDAEHWRPKPFQAQIASRGKSMPMLPPGSARGQSSGPRAAPLPRASPSVPSGPGLHAVGAVPSRAPISTNPSKAALNKNLFPTPQVHGKRRIDYPGGYLAKDPSGLWHEQKGSKRFATFQQRRGRPNDDYVMLYDASRQLHLRIDGKGVCHFIQGDLETGEWRINFRGTWS